jgi:hypothetical protein
LSEEGGPVTLVGRAVEIIVSEPWGFGSEVGTSLPAKITEESPHGFIVKLDRPTQFKGTTFCRLVATARNGRFDVGALAGAFGAPANLAPLSGSAPAGEEAWAEVGRWRGWFLVGSLRLKP